MSEKKKINPLLIVLLILVPIFLIIIALLVGICIKLSVDKAQAEKLTNEYKAVIEEQKEAEKTASEYQLAYNKLILAMLDDAALAESNGNLIIQVWNNAIWNKQDVATDKYTMVDGKFVSDFNDALSNLFNDESFSTDRARLSANQQRIKTDMKEMVNPPEGYEEAYKALKDLYDSYLSFSNIVLNCNGSLNSFSDDFSEADKDILKKYNAAELYAK